MKFETAQDALRQFILKDLKGSLPRPAAPYLEMAAEVAAAAACCSILKPVVQRIAEGRNQAPAANDGWLPIATAPKDGTPVLLYKPDEPRVGEYTLAGYWGDWPGTGECWIACDGKPLGYFSEWAGADQGYPTHWAPLPPAPKVPAAEMVAF